MKNREERRRHRRYEVEGLSGKIADRHDFDILLLSRGGLLLTTGFEPPLGQVVDLEVPLPGGVFRSASRVVFVGEDSGAPRGRRYRVGVAFAVESDADAAILDGFITREIEHPEQPMGTETP
ncbi:MAG TPA: PilZ domain-containing protein [Thermoanaerobaculia bacterium]|nr:PilZ domain-containing protein [Thermoanaerobaculia bacterium]